MEAKSNNVKLKKAWLLWEAMPFLLSAFRCGEEKVEPETLHESEIDLAEVFPAL